ncbi:RDD family protein [Kitasatospora sp. NPDC093550]|uniref:RDD family protein n=1 Tax=Kitasatospora sp. NPDC093550 TaxID=3364089 RepID=UPI0037FCA480
MTDRSFADGGDPAVAPGPGYYPDPSIPGFVRYWGGSAWVPGTSRPAPAEGEVLEPPRYATRRPAPGARPARAVPPPVVPEAAAPVPEPTPVSAPRPVPVSVPEVEPSVGGGDTGPVYFDQTSGGASFVLGPRVAEVIGGPVFRTVGPTAGGGAPGLSEVALGSDVPLGAGAPAGGGTPAGAVPIGTAPTGAASTGTAPTGAVEGAAVGTVAATTSGAAPEESGWQADPRAQRGLMETGGAPRWVSWGVLPGAPEAEEGRAEAERAPVAVELATAVAPAMAVAVREAPAVEASGAVPVVAQAAVTGARAKQARAEDAAAAEAGRGAATTAVPTTPMPAVRQARQTAVRRRSASRAAVPAGLGRRLAARAVDTAVLLVVAVAAGIPLAASVSDHIQEKLDQARMASALTRRQVQVWLVDDVVVGKIAVLIGILLFVSLLYEVLPTARTGQTFGKRLARIRVVDVAAPGTPAARAGLSLGRSLTRWVVRQVGTVLLLGLVWPVFDRPARRGWQDRAARTRVVRA